MSKRVRDIFTRDELSKGQRGFTLIELVAVMAILAILVAIVAPAAINSERAGITAQAEADSPRVREAANSFFIQQGESELRTPHTVTLTTTVNSATASSTQIVSSRWPEMYVTQGTGAPSLTSTRTATSKYSAIFETGVSPKVVNVVLKDKVGVTISASNLLTKFTAIDLQKLADGGQLNKMPDGVEQTSATGLTGLSAPNFLWLFKKQSSSIGTDDDRAVVVFTLVKVDQIEASGGATTVNATYDQILGP